VNALASDAGVLHVRVKVKNVASGHRAPAGPGSAGYVVTVNAEQRGRKLPLRFGNRVPDGLRSLGRDAGIVFARDYRDKAGQPTNTKVRISDLVADTRLESGRFQQTDFLFDRRDTSAADLEVVLWHLPDVTTWKGAKAIRRAAKSELH